MTRLTVSIINYKTGDLTLQCVGSVLADLDGLDVAARVVVVDNRSDDGSAERIADWIDAQDPAVPVTLVRSATNSGFSGGHNQGIAAAPADLTLILNSDAVVRPGFFRALLDAAAARPEVGLFAPRIDYDETDGQGGGTQVNCFRFPGPVSEIIRGANTGPVTKILRRRDVPLSMPPDEAQIEWASFAFILIRGAVIEAVGPMDEGYFLYFEDAAYCLAARRAGWRIAYVGDAVAIHFRGGSGPVKALAAAKKRMPAYYYASRTRFFRQAHGVLGPILGNLGWHLGRAIARARILLGKPVPQAVDREAGDDIWINATRPLGPSFGPGAPR